MKRRDILKTGALLTGAVLVSSLQGCNKETSESSSDLKITPKQTGLYKFSAPMPFNFELIDEIVEINKRNKKSKVTTLYNSIPAPLAKNLIHLQGSRGENKNLKTFEDFSKYVIYAQKNGFNFIYTLNSPKPFLSSEIKEKEKEINLLVEKLEKINCKKIKAANPQILDIIGKNHPEIELSASTSLEFHTINQYINFFEKYPKIKKLDLTLDENKNFDLLINFKKLFPDVELELMANEVCIFGCPLRIVHPSSAQNSCAYEDIIKKDVFIHICKSRHINPWDMEYYSALGINNFKLMKGGRANLVQVNFIAQYLDAIEKNLNEIALYDYFDKILPSFVFEKFNIDKKITLEEAKEYFPKIEHYIQNGHNCAQNCNTKCRYCYTCAKKLKEFLS